MFQGIEQVVNDNFEGGIRDLGLAEDGMDLGGILDSVDPAITDTVAAYKQAIIDGTITVPADDDEFAAWTPTPLEGSATPSASPAATPAS